MGPACRHRRSPASSLERLRLSGASIGTPDPAGDIGCGLSEDPPGRVDVEAQSLGCPLQRLPLGRELGGHCRSIGPGIRASAPPRAATAAKIPREESRRRRSSNAYIAGSSTLCCDHHAHLSSSSAYRRGSPDRDGQSSPGLRETCGPTGRAAGRARVGAVAVDGQAAPAAGQRREIAQVITMLPECPFVIRPLKVAAAKQGTIRPRISPIYQSLTTSFQGKD